ncbi:MULTISPECIES: hypothetical protein [unclassified Streptomyces]|nr:MULTISPECIES: hypothetical protein [unclassified Streptomyces]
MSTKTGLFVKLFGKSDNKPASDCCDVQIIEEDETVPQQQRAESRSDSDS